MRRYELMLVLRPDAPEDRVHAVLEKTTRHVIGTGGQIVKAGPLGPPPPRVPDRSVP